jgi:IS1 family transposase/transposase-like protein
MRKPRDWKQPCPNPECNYYTLISRGNVSAVSTYLTQSGRRRIFNCKECKSFFSETRGTVFYDLRTPDEKVIMALKMFLIRVDLAGICFVLGITEETSLRWLRRAAKQADAINAQLMRDLSVTEIQLDEMWNFIKRKCTEESTPEGESPETSEDGRQWIWISFAAEFRLILATLVGPRTSESALSLIQKTAEIVKGVPCFFSDGFSAYLPALIAVYHQIITFPHTGKRGRPKDPVTEPHPDLVYGQIIKEKKGGRLKALKRRILCGAERLKELGLNISTSLIERLNLTLRQSLAPLVRKSLGFCKDRELMRKRVTFFQVFYNFSRPHQSLRVPLPENQRISQGAIHTKWLPRTPGMAAGITDHVWSFRELLTIKFEPIHNQSTSG